jgi:hypothetical protein
MLRAEVLEKIGLSVAAICAADAFMGSMPDRRPVLLNENIFEWFNKHILGPEGFLLRTRKT